jgi:hypothetical protein
MLEYQRDIPARSSNHLVEETKRHVRDHLAAIADSDDDPSTHADQVDVWVMNHPDDPGQMRVKGMLKAEADAPYLKDDFDPYEGVDPDLMSEVLGGQD